MSTTYDEATLNGLRSGPAVLVEMIFERARRDIEARNEWAPDAWAFLRDPNTIAALVDLGIDPQHYIHMLDSRPDIDARRRGLMWRLYAYGLAKDAITEAVFGYSGGRGYKEVSRVLAE